jgi:hypothetical protein
MRQREHRVVALFVAVDQNVDVECSRPKSDAAHPFRLRLELVGEIQELAGGALGLEHNDAVQERSLVLWTTDGSSLIDRRNRSSRIELSQCRDTIGKQ